MVIQSTPQSVDNRDDEHRDDESSVGPDDHRATAPIPLDDVFDVLRNERRRAVLRQLRDGEPPIDVRSVSEAIAAAENDKPAAQLHSAERKRVYVGLYQYHLPKMDSLSVVRFEKNRGHVYPGPALDRVLPYLDPPAPTRTDPWLYRLLGATALAGVLLLAGAMGGGTWSTRVAVAGAVVVLACCGLGNWLAHRAQDGGA